MFIKWEKNYLRNLKMLEIDGFEGQVLENEPLSNHCTWKIGGTAKYIVFPNDEKELELILDFAIKNNILWYVIGNGSNILFPDEGIDGIVIKMNRGFKNKCCISYKNREDVVVYLSAGLLVSEALSFLIKMELEGLEFISGIPGCIGGLLKMNAGAFGKEIGNFVEWVNIYNPCAGTITLKKEDLKFSYRKLELSEDFVILGGAFLLKKGDKEKIKSKIEEYQKIRKERQPLGLASCGSVFKNPKEGPAGKIIEELGLKGFQVGGARISDIHANFIVNTGNATAKDVLTLIELIKQKVWLKRGINLEEEVVKIGIKKSIKARVI
ncbi:MAG: UDP-N-acetylmuramate dehydrogenase [Proteobacteria bacterium]|nr:UDP-N-acetylmuramate dehydrogenase [Pseudomonadota bacterium]